MLSEKLAIGVYRLTVSTVFQQLYECAAWYKDILVPAGDYTLYGQLDQRDPDGPKIADRSIGVTLEGIVIASNFTSYYCGVAVGRGKVNEHVNETATYGVYPYAHAVAHALLGQKWDYERYQLIGYEARYVDFIGYDGKPGRTAGIFPVDVSQQGV